MSVGDTLGASSMLRLIRRTVTLTRKLTTLDLIWEYEECGRDVME